MVGSLSEPCLFCAGNCLTEDGLEMKVGFTAVRQNMEPKVFLIVFLYLYLVERILTIVCMVMGTC
jgi:hypothetical protein